MKHLFVSMSVKQNLFVSVFVHKCLMVLNDAKCATLKLFVAQRSNYLFVISFQLMVYKTLRCSLARPLVVCPTHFKKFYVRHTSRTIQDKMSVSCLLLLSVKMFYIFADLSRLS